MEHKCVASDRLESVFNSAAGGEIRRKYRVAFLAAAIAGFAVDRGLADRFGYPARKNRLGSYQVGYTVRRDRQHRADITLSCIGLHAAIPFKQCCLPDSDCDVHYPVYGLLPDFPE